MQIKQHSVISEPTLSTRNIAIVDDSMLARSMLVKYLSAEPQFTSVGCFTSPTELLRSTFDYPPDCLVISLRKASAADDDLIAEFARKFPACQALIAGHPETSETRFSREFSRRCFSFPCSADARASEVATQTLQHLKQSLQSRRVRTSPAIAALAQSSTINQLADIQVSQEQPEEARSTEASLGSKPLTNGRSKLVAASNTSTNRRTASGLPTRLIVIGGSTGAPAAVTKLLQQLPADFPLPIAVSLHMLEDFTGRLAQSLDRATKLQCKEASDNELLKPSTVYIARGDHHLTVEKNDQGRFVSRLNREPPEHFARPSVNQLFRSAAIAAGPATVAVMLTGIGSDGLEGTEILVRRGGMVIAQDEASSTVWGMPAAVVHAGLAKEILSPGEAGQFIAMKIAVEAKRQQG